MEHVCLSISFYVTSEGNKRHKDVFLQVCTGRDERRVTTSTSCLLERLGCFPEQKLKEVAQRERERRVAHVGCGNVVCAVLKG